MSQIYTTSMPVVSKCKLFIETASVCVLLTHCVDESCVQFSCQQRVRQVSEELLQQSSNVVDTVLIAKVHFPALIKLLTELDETSSQSVLQRLLFIFLKTLRKLIKVQKVTCRTLFLELPTRKIPTVCKPEQRHECFTSGNNLIHIHKMIDASEVCTIFFQVLAAEINYPWHLSVNRVKAELFVTGFLPVPGCLIWQRQLKGLQQPSLVIIEVSDAIHRHSTLSVIRVTTM